MHYEFPISRIIKYAQPRFPIPRKIDSLKKPLIPWKQALFRPDWFFHLYQQTEQPHIFHSLGLREETKKRFIDRMKLANYKYANAIFTTRNPHYGLEAIVTGAGNIQDLTIDTTENMEKFNKLPKKQQSLLLQSLVLEACNKAGELKRSEMKEIYQTLFEELYEDCELEESKEAKERATEVARRVSEKGFDARGKRLQKAVSFIVAKEKEKGFDGTRPDTTEKRETQFSLMRRSLFNRNSNAQQANTNANTNTV